jgi:predicted PurR-regulated permease PerM
MAKVRGVLKKVGVKPSKVQEVQGFGMKGAPLNTQHPFYFGFLAASGALVAIALLRALQSASQVFVLIIIALFLAMGLNPTVEALQARKLSRSVAVSLVVFIAIGIIALFTLVVIPPVASQGNDLIESAPQLLDSLRSNATINQLNVDYGFIDSLESKFEEWISDGKIITGAFGGVLGVGRTVLSGAFSALTVLVLTLYFLISLPSVTKIFYRLAPASRRARVSSIGDAIISRVGSFVGSQVLIAALAALFVFALALGIELPYAAALAMVILFVALIPLIGHFLGASIVVLVALTQSPGKALLALILYTAYVQIENFIITPRIMKRSLAIPGLVTIVAALLGTSLLGLVGGILAIPIAAAILLIMDEVVFPKTDNA